MTNTTTTYKGYVVFRLGDEIIEQKINKWTMEMFEEYYGNLICDEIISMQLDINHDEKSYAKNSNYYN